jgi:hypothetical protein
MGALLYSGITLIFASGDTGAGLLGPAPMTVPNCDTLHADWPCQSAYVTGVSASPSLFVFFFIYIYIIIIIAIVIIYLFICCLIA